MRLKGKGAIITGGASGFGAGIVRSFVAEGERVAIADRNIVGARELAVELGEAAIAVQVDVSLDSSVANMAVAVNESFGGIDILVNNAGIGHVPQALAVELATQQIRVNAINPVAGDTPLLATFMGEDTPEVRAKFLASIPLGRFSTPADMGAAAAFLCSDDAGMITGVAMEVDGGRCI